MRKRILFLQQVLRPPGGACSVAAWMLQALQDNYDITVLAQNERNVNLPGLNRFYGTSLRCSEISVLYPHPFMRSMLRLDPDRNSIQPLAYMMRMCRQIRRNYDFVVTAATEEVDLGGPGLLYVHYPYLTRFWSTYQDGTAGLSGLLRGKTRPWMIMAGYSIERMKQNTFLANSDWTGRILHESYNVPVRTVYPPVTTAPVQLPWEARENSFVCVGRLDPGKRVDWIIQMLSAVRKRHPDIRLHLVGTRETNPLGVIHYRVLRELVARNSEWVHFHEDLTRDALLELLGRCRYGIHAMRDEHFGMAPAETLMAGCIPFVHDSGGQVEIVGNDPRLCYRDDDAAEKIDAVLSSPETQSEIQRRLPVQRDIFSLPRFLEAIRSVVDSAVS